MTKTSLFVVLILLALIVPFRFQVQADEVTSNEGVSKEAMAGGIYSQCFSNLPGVESEGMRLIVPQLSTVVVSTLNPLLTMLAIGGCTYVFSDSDSSSLPLPAQPWFLLTIGFFVGIFMLKDFLLPLMPAAKIPLDQLEALVQIASSPVAVAFLMASLGSSLVGAESGTPLAALLAQPPAIPFMAAGISGVLGSIVMAVLVFAGLFYILILSTALHVLIAICPVPILDTAIKYFRNGYCLLLIILSLISPYLGIIFLFITAYWSKRLADSTFRLATSGVFYLFSTIFTRQKEFEGECWAVSKSIEGIKNNLVGKLIISDTGKCEFVYRKYLFLTTNRVVLGYSQFTIRKNFQGLCLIGSDGQNGVELLMVSKKYADSLRKQYSETKADAEKMNFKMGVNWIKGQFRANPSL